MDQKIKVVIILGTRPEAIKLLPLYNQFKQDSFFKPVLVSTGQHKEMLQQVFDIFGVEPEVDLNLMTQNQSLAEITALLFSHLQKTFDEIKPDLVIVQGDTQSAYVGSMVAFQNRIKVAHIEAGLRTYNKFSPFPEEINRQGIGLVTDYHFAPTEVAVQNLEKENKKGIFMVGNTVIDALFWCDDIVKNKSAVYDAKFETCLKNDKVVLVTGHRRENFEFGLDAIANALLYLANKYPEINFVYPVHLNPMVREVIFSKLSNLSNIFLIEPLQYDEMIYMLSKSFCVITDSGGLQEEAPSLNVPVLVTRDTTERPEGIDAGCAKLVGINENDIIDTFVELIENPAIYNAMANSKNPYGNGDASIKIVNSLKEQFQ